MFSLIVTVGLILKTKIKSNNESENEVQTSESMQSSKESIQLNRNNMIVENNNITSKQVVDGGGIQKPNTIWKQVGITVAGGNGPGNQSNELFLPAGIFVNTNQTIYIADYWNHRIVEWKFNTTNGRTVAGGNGEGNQNNQLNYPLDVIVDQENDSLIISDTRNRRVVQWSRQNNTNGQIIISNIDCSGLTLDKNGFIYVADIERNEVRRWRKGEEVGITVAGGNGKGNQLNQFNYPTFICVDNDYSLYVSDENNHRVMKWSKDAKEGIVAAGGINHGSSLAELFSPHGIIVDQFGQIYVADYYNHRVMRWSKGAKQGTIVVGRNQQQFNQLNSPAGLSFDRQGNLYVVDHWGYRVQKFEIDYNENNLLE